MRTKYISAFLISFFLLGNLHSQVTLERTYNFSIGTTKINSTTWKYILMDVPLSQCRLYNMDHSLFKTISCPVPTNNYLYDIKYVTENVFNNDNTIELLYTYYEWVITGGSTGGSTGYYKYGTKVITESGTQLMDCPGALYSYVYAVSDNDARLFLYCYDNSVTPYKIWTNIYKVEGDINAILSQKTVSLKSISATIEEPYPNPANSYITIPYTLDENIVNATLTVFDSSGKLIREYNVDHTFNDLIIFLDEYPSGTYFYKLTAKSWESPAQSFIIQK